ncbi:hypothetical protein DRO30_05010 [Candidatus Bathyarchaeota archaeon]|nr:MAG: hypothetical protein DRO30_05010 [Candidatus Bathyarchaeota archaeon]
MSKYHSVGVLRLVLDLWRSSRTHTIMDKLLKSLANYYAVELNKVFPYTVRHFERLLKLLGYEVKGGVVNN